MLRFFTLLLPIVFLIITVTSCIEEPNNIDSNEAFIRAQFFNIDSLTKVTVLKEILTEDLLLINDSIGIVQDSIDNGNTTYDALLPPLQLKKEELDSLNAVLADVMETINSGLIKVDQITADNAAQPLTYEDSLSIYVLPLPQESNSVTYRITIAGQEKSVGFSFEQSLVNEHNVLKMKANIPLSAPFIISNFDSLLLTCADTLCITDDATISLYF